MESTLCWGLGSLEFPSFVAGLPGQIVSLLCDLPRQGFSREREAGGAFCPLSVCLWLPIIYGTLCWVWAVFCFLAHIPTWDHLPSHGEPGIAILCPASPQGWGHTSETWCSVSIYRLHRHLPHLPIWDKMVLKIETVSQGVLLLLVFSVNIKSKDNLLRSLYLP